MKLQCTRGARYEYQDPATKKQYYSVSQVLCVMDPDAFAGIDPFILATAQDRGKNLHVLFALTLLRLIGLSDLPVQPTGIIGHYYAGITKFVRERKPRALRVEAQGVNDTLKIAGTLDTECFLDERPESWIIDLKTGPARAVHAAQLIGGYKRLSGSEQAKRFGSLYITKKGTYHLEEHTHSYVDQAGFDGGLTTLNWRRYRNIR